MVNFKLLDFENDIEYMNYLLETLLETNRTFDFFVNWDKVFNNVKTHVIEISILNSLNKSDKDDLHNDFKKILMKYPEVVNILPSILAIRFLNKKNSILPIFNIDLKTVKHIDFDKNNFNMDEIITFCDKTGLLELIYNVDDLYSYLIGAEVGLDTNARKSRSGHIFEKIVGELLKNKIKKFDNIKLVKEDTKVVLENRKKRIDYVIYKNNEPHIAIECNFYSSIGSKPSEIAQSYAKLQKEFDNKNIIFIWVTDGYGWKKMSNAINSVKTEVDYIFNYHMLDLYFDKILKIETNKN